MSLEELLQEIKEKLTAYKSSTYDLEPEQQRELAELLREASDLILEDLEEQQA